MSTPYFLWVARRTSSIFKAPSLLLCLPFLLIGCAALPLESPVIPHPSSRAGPAVQAKFREVVGVIHVHSTYSDGRLPIEAIARIANAQDLDVLILTDHDTLQARRDGKGGFYGKTLVLVDEEISTKAGHYLALRIQKEIPKFQHPRWTIEAVSAQGGLGFLAHPFWKRRPWLDRELDGITGLEIYSAVHDVAEHHPLHLFLLTVFGGSELTLIQWLDRPYDPLRLWDQRLSQGNRVVGIGGADAHGLRRFGLRLGPYATMFKLVRTHLLLKELSADGVYEALEKGRAFVAHDIVADARGFAFLALFQNLVRGVMGDEVKWQRGLKLYGYLPSAGEMTLLKDGQVIAAVEGQHGWFEVESPGIYRLEATRSGKPWIYSNPIYVVE